MRSFLRLLRSARRLDRRSRRAAARAIVWLAAMRIALATLPLAMLRRLVARIRPRRTSSSLMSDECARAIERAAGVLPGTRCLAQALAAECLLRREGQPAQLRLGVLMDEGQLRAHAWLISDGTTVTGQRDAARYAALAPRLGP